MYVDEELLLPFYAWRELVVIRAERKCERCGTEGRMLAHHKDRDQSNNRLSNGECLCQPCHNREHFTGVALSEEHKANVSAGRQKSLVAS